MGKRKEEKDDYEYLVKKIRKLEKTIKRKHRSKPKTASSPCSARSPPLDKDTTPEIDLTIAEEDNEINSFKPLPSTNENCEVGTAMLPAAEQILPSEDLTTEPLHIEDDIIEPPLPPDSEDKSEILALLGEDPSIVTNYGKDIQSDLAVRLQHVATTGLSKEARKELADKYLPPGNCTMIDAPALNPEVKTAVSEAVLKRDKAIETKQHQLGRAISSVGEAITLLLSRENKDTAAIKILMDASRIMCDCQNADSITRRNFVLYNLKKDMKDQIQTTKIDKFLFGTELAETLRSAKVISKSSADLKPAPPAKATYNKNKQTTSTVSTPRNLNWKVPPFNRRQKGAPRAWEPAQRFQHANYSRTSFRPPPTSNRGRH